jgi:hypothetical protein
LAEAIDSQLELLRFHKPYHKSDHVLNFAYNALCDGDCLEDMELRRTDEACLNSIGAQRTPDPTTTGDFCRRFDESDVRTLQNVFHDVRLEVWERQSDAFFDEAIIDMDGTVETNAEKMQGIDISYKGIWGYHPLVVSLANTGEILSLVTRSGSNVTERKSDGLLNGPHDVVVFVDLDHDGSMLLNFFFVQLHVTANDDQIVWLAQSGRCAVDTDFTTLFFHGDNVCFPSSPRTDVINLDFFKRKQLGGFDQQLIHGNAAFVIQVGARYFRSMNL